VHWANHANELINFITLPCALVGPGSWSWWNEPVIVSLNFILFQKKTKKHRAPHHHIAPQITRYQKTNKQTQTKKNKPEKKPIAPDGPGVNGTLPRISISDHESLRVQGLQGLRSVPASPAVKLVHRLDLEDRLPRLCASAGRARRSAPNHIHLLFPGRLCGGQLEATELSVPTFFIPHIPPSPPLFFFPTLLDEMINSMLMFVLIFPPSPPFVSRSSLIRIIVRRGRGQAAKHHGSNTQRSDTRFASASISAAVEFSRTTICSVSFWTLTSWYVFSHPGWALYCIATSHQVKVPSLVRAVRDAGLLIAAYGTAENLANLVSSTQSIDGGAVDAVFQEGVLGFYDHFPRTWF
jgi:hypothetical protein